MSLSDCVNFILHITVFSVVCFYIMRDIRNWIVSSGQLFNSSPRKNSVTKAMDRLSEAKNRLSKAEVEFFRARLKKMEAQLNLIEKLKAQLGLIEKLEQQKPDIPKA